MEVFTQMFASNGQALNDTEAKIIDENSFSNELERGKVIFLGDGAAKCRSMLDAHPNAIFLDNRLSSAAGMGKLVYENYREAAYENLMAFEPFYLKDFVTTKSKKKIL